MTVPQVISQTARTFEGVPKVQFINQSHQVQILLINRFWLVVDSRTRDAQQLALPGFGNTVIVQDKLSALRPI